MFRYRNNDRAIGAKNRQIVGFGAAARKNDGASFCANEFGNLISCAVYDLTGAGAEPVDGRRIAEKIERVIGRRFGDGKNRRRRVVVEVHAWRRHRLMVLRVPRFLAAVISRLTARRFDLVPRPKPDDQGHLES